MLKSSIGFIFSLVFSLIILEIFLQKSEIETTSTTDFDEVIGRKRRANLDFTFFNEGFSMGSFNQYAYLGPGYIPEKKPEIFRIAILGDSYVESFQLFRRDQFHTLMEQQLSKMLGKKVEVLNFGRSGFDFADMYAYEKRMVARFNPDLVLYFLSEADLQCTQTDLLIPKVIEENDSLSVTNEKMPADYLETYNNTKILTQNFSLFQMINNSRKLIIAGKFWPKMLDKFYIPSTKSNIEVRQNVALISPLAFQIVKHLPTNSIIVNRGDEPLPNEFLNAISTKQIPAIDLNDTLNILIENGIDPHYWAVTKTRGHWNYPAHQAVGRYLSRQLDIYIKEAKEF